MKKEMILSLIYVIGLCVFLLIGWCEFNWLFVVAIVIAILGIGHLIYQGVMKKN